MNRIAQATGRARGAEPVVYLPLCSSMYRRLVALDTIFAAPQS